jgi:hypothetical protein
MVPVRFWSSPHNINALISQLVELAHLKRQVTGSNPVGGTKYGFQANLEKAEGNPLIIWNSGVGGLARMTEDH